MAFVYKKLLLLSFLLNSIATVAGNIRALEEIIPVVLKKYQNMAVNINFLDTIRSKFMAKSQEFSDAESDFLAYEFCKHISTSHIIIIWPRALQYSDYIINEITNHGKVIYSRKRSLKNKALPYLIRNIPEKAPNLDFHLQHYFNNQSSGDIIAVLCTFPSLEHAVRCKQIIRKHLNLSPLMIALHVADTQDQSMTLAQIFFNNNTINYLNNTLPFSRYEKFNFLFKQYKTVINSLKLDNDLFCVDGSSILAMYGIRDVNVDFDFLSYFKKLDLPSTFYTLNNKKLGPLDIHNQAWLNARVDPIETIFDPHYHFYYEGFKCATLERMRLFKYNQNREIDRRDVLEIDKILIGLYR